MSVVTAPAVVAHRGSSADAPEHTLAAYQQAITDGADALECDVRLTADGHLVCVHDRNLRRTAAAKGVVSTMNLEEFDELDFASWKNPWAGPARVATRLAADTAETAFEATAARVKPWRPSAPDARNGTTARLA